MWVSVSYGKSLINLHVATDHFYFNGLSFNKTKNEWFIRLNGTFGLKTTDSKIIVSKKKIIELSFWMSVFLLLFEKRLPKT